MRRFLIFFLLVIFITFFGGILFFSKSFEISPPQSREVLIKEVEIKKEILLPPPLRKVPKEREEETEVVLNPSEVIKWTNIEREGHGLSPLKENEKLQKSARLKAEDMFQNQYFGHVSPSGKKLEDLIKEAGYEYIVVGENLALGNFLNEKTLVEEWMESPGHRENILKASFEEIGVFTMKGLFETKPALIAVQHFGRPLSACPQVKEGLRAEIEDNQSQMTHHQENLKTLEEEIQNMALKPDSKYIQKIEEHNALVEKYNNLVVQTKELVEKYNFEVKLFNECASR